MTLSVTQTSSALLAPRALAALPEPQPDTSEKSYGSNGGALPPADSISESLMQANAATTPDLHATLQHLLQSVPGAEALGESPDAESVRLMALNVQQGLSAQDAPIVSAQSSALLNLFRS